MKMSKIVSALSTAVFSVGIMAIPVSDEQDPFTNEYFRVEQREEHGFAFADNILTKTDENGTYGYTGRVKINGKTKFYDNGVLWTGWRKIGGKWYYFDPESDGIMAEEKAKTSLGYYYFDEDGAWNGKVSKSALCPEDFEFMMSDIAEGLFGFEINTFDGLLKVPNLYNDDDSRSISLSKRDKQIFYDVIMSCKLTEIENDLFADHLYEINADSFSDDDVVLIGASDASIYTTKFSADGENYKVTGGYEMYWYYPYENSGDVRNYAHFLAFARRYVWDMPEYSEIEAANKAATTDYYIAYYAAQDN